MAMAAAMVMAGQCRQVRRGQYADEDDVSMKVTMTMMMHEH
jgi:hypothetical protein